MEPASQRSGKKEKETKRQRKRNKKTKKKGAAGITTAAPRMAGR
jgi:hypothetical protein